MRKSRLASLAGFLTAAILVVLAPVSAAGQTSDATLAGRVLDDQAAVIPGASVTATNVDTGRGRTVTSDGSGRFRIAALPPGRYTLEVILEGFAKVVRSGLVLATSQEATIDITLSIAGANETISVTADAPLVDVTSVQIGTTVSNEQLNALPIQGRDFSSLAALAPGVAAVGTNELSAAGQSDAQNGYLLDGINNKAPNQGGSRGAVSLEAVQEFVVIANQFSAEYGQAAGALISAVTRSGTNRTEGRVFYFHRNEKFNASGPFDTSTTQPFSSNRYGFFLGGPIKRDKIHYFVTDEVLSERSSDVITALGVPDSDRDVPQPFDQHQPLAKVDLRVNANQSMWFRYRLDTSDEINDGIGGLNTWSQGSTRWLSNQDVTASHSWVIGPRLLNELRVNGGYRLLDLDPRNYSDQYTPQENRPSSVTGGASSGRQLTAAPSGYITENLSFTTGDHSFKFGGEFQKYGGQLDSCPGGRGTFTFNTDTPFNPAVLSTYPTRYTQTVAPDFPTCRIPLPNTGYVAFAQDSWRARPGLTLNLGLRYDTDKAWESVTGLKIDDRANLAPRIGVVWDPFADGKTAIRGGYGIYVDQGLLNTPLTVQRGRIWQNVTITNPGYPDPYSRPGAVVAPTRTDIADELRTAETRSFTIGIKRQLVSRIALSMDFVHTGGYNELYGIDTNAPVNGQRPDPKLATVTEVTSGARTFYKSLLVNLEANRSALRYGASYTWALAESYSEGRQSLPADGINIANDFGPSNNDRRHQFVSHVSWLAPYQIQVAAILKMRSGTPVNITTGIDNNANLQTTDRPDLVDPDGDPFALSTYSSDFTGRNGDLPRNYARGPYFGTLDLRLTKIVTVHGYRFEIFGEGYNILNKVNFNNPNGNMRNNNFGRSTNITGNMRQLEFGLRFDFGI